MDFLYIDKKQDYFIEEQHNLEKNIKEIDENIENKKQYKEKLANEVDNSKGDYENIEYIVKCKDKIKTLNNEITFLEETIDNPYFGHMILALNNEIIDMFIGYNSIDNSKLEKIVYDWRSDVGTFYRTNQITYKYKSYLYELQMKRAVEIENRNLISCSESYNSDGENKDVNDYFLRKLLKEKKNEKGFTDIVRSIQKEQNEIISLDLHKNLLCQGVAGSGKTAIIVHRISYLLFNNPTITPEQFLFIAPNNNFKRELNELNQKLQIDKITLKTLYEYYIDKLNAYIDVNEEDIVRTIIDDKENNISYMYSPNNIIDNLNIVENELLKIINNYKEKYNIIINEEGTIIQKSSNVYNNIINIIKGIKENVKKIKENIDSLNIELKMKTNFIFMNTEEDTIIENNFMKRIHEKFVNLKKEYKQNDFEAVTKKINENKEKIKQNELLILENIKEKNEKSRNEFLSKLFNRKEFNKRLDKIKQIETKISNLKEENRKLNNELKDFASILEKQDNIKVLDVLEKFAISINELLKLIDEKKEYLKLTNHERIDLNIRYKNIMNKIYNTNFKVDIKQLEKIEDEIEQIKNKLNSIDWNTIKNEREILEGVKKEFSPYNIMMIYLNNNCKDKYDLSEKLSYIQLYRSDAFIILSIINKLGFKNKIKYNYLYIDEAQDYNDQEIKLLKELEKSNMNIFGDYKQNITSNLEKRENWNSLRDIFNGELEYYELNENYRNTINVVKYCKDNLNLDMLPVGIEGNEVIIKENQSITELINNAKKLDAIVITNNQHIRSKIKEKSDVRVFTVKDVKGLEFKNAIVIDDDLDINSRYISYTRALQDLIIYRNINKDEE